MAKLGRPRIKERPENYELAVEEVLEDRMSRKDAATKYGINYAWFCRLFQRDYPRFKSKTDWQKKATREVGKANLKYVSWLEKNINDRDLCDFIKSMGKCGECPRTCKERRSFKGLAKQIAETRIDLKDA